jgi:hypothetical protein
VTIAADKVTHWELGSEFHWLGVPEPPFLAWPQPAVWYMLARHAVAALLEMKAANSPSLWLPTYFCPEVAECCRPYGEIREYRDMPSWAEPDWKSLEPEPDDVVLAVNYFGVRDGDHWREWRGQVSCVLLEDHSQDPFSAWASTSTADFAFASARKTLPIPDGAILWSPRGLMLPSQPADGDWRGSDLKATAMMYKAEYLRGGGSDELKRRYRHLQLTGEDLLRKSRISAISPFSSACIAEGAPQASRNRRSANARHLASKLIGVEHFNRLISGWPVGAVPFALPVIFPSRRERDECQLALRRNRIYCPVHWVCETSDVEALDLASRMLSLPIDQRYEKRDMDSIAETLLRYEHSGRMDVAAEAEQA